MEQIIEIVGVIIGLVYLYFEYHASHWLWRVGILMSLFYIAVFFQAKFYADAFIYLYYLAANIYGVYVWQHYRRKERSLGKETSEPGAESADSETAEEQKFGHVPAGLILPLSLIILALWAVIWFILSHYTDSPVPVGDALTTASGFVAMYMMARKYIEHWHLWVMVNAVSSFLYFQQHLYAMGALFILYTVVSVLGYFKWKRLIRA